jgi:hypothetical protein
MTVIAVPTFAPRRNRLTFLALLLALFLGLLSFAAVGEMAVKCEQGYLLLDQGGYALSNSGERFALQQLQCYIAAGDVRLPLPPWLSAMFR